MRKNVFKQMIMAAAALCVFCAQGTLAPIDVSAQKTIRVLGRIDNAGQTLYESNIIALMDSTGLVIGATTVPGLGYTVIRRELDDPDDPDLATIEPGTDLAFFSQTVSSGDTNPHMGEAVPQMTTEQAIGRERTTRNGFFFSTGAGTSTDGETHNLVITNNSHPITSIFSLGAFASSGPRIGEIRGTLATGITVLAQSSRDAAFGSLAIIDTGQGPLIAGGPTGYDPAPARRVWCGMGVNDDGFAAPLVDEAFLLQRCVQWAIGDPVTAGGVAGIEDWRQTSVPSGFDSLLAMLNLDRPAFLNQTASVR